MNSERFLWMNIADKDEQFKVRNKKQLLDLYIISRLTFTSFAKVRNLDALAATEFDLIGKGNNSPKAINQYK